MPRKRSRRTRDSGGRRRTRSGFLPALVVFLFLLLSACGNDRETLLPPPASNTPAGMAGPASDQTATETESVAMASDGQEIPPAGITLHASVADNVDDACVGAKEVTVEPQGLLFFCVQVGNLGAVPLTDVEVVFKDGDVDLGSFTPHLGTFDHIDPGGVLLATLAEPVVNGRLAGVIAEEGLNVWLEASAMPVDSAGVDLEEVLAESQVLVRVEADYFSTGLATVAVSGADALFDVGHQMFPALELILPFVAFLALVAVLIRWARSRPGFWDRSHTSR